MEIVRRNFQRTMKLMQKWWYEGEHKKEQPRRHVAKLRKAVAELRVLARLWLKYPKENKLYKCKLT
jgi:hypothetical protein